MNARRSDGARVPPLDVTAAARLSEEARADPSPISLRGAVALMQERDGYIPACAQEALLTGFGGERVAIRFNALAEAMRGQVPDIAPSHLLRATPKKTSRRGRGARGGGGAGRGRSAGPRSRSIRGAPSTGRGARQRCHEPQPERVLTDAQHTLIATNRAAARLRRARVRHQESAGRLASMVASGEVCDPGEYGPLQIPAAVRSAIEDRCLRRRLGVTEVPDISQGANPCVCLVDFQADTDALRLPCLHQFHFDCVARWFTEDIQSIFSHDGFEDLHRMRCPFCYVSITQM